MVGGTQFSLYPPERSGRDRDRHRVHQRGTSHTVAFSEWVRGDGLGRGVGWGPQNAKDGLGQIYVCNPSCFISQFAGQFNMDYLFSKSATPPPPESSRLLPGRENGISPTSFTYSHTMGPNRRSCWYSDPGLNGGINGAGTGRPWTGAANLIAASSKHPGGVNTAFADGSVRFIMSTVSSQTWVSLGTRNGGEVISGSAY